MASALWPENFQVKAEISHTGQRVWMVLAEVSKVADILALLLIQCTFPQYDQDDRKIVVQN